MAAFLLSLSHPSLSSANRKECSGNIFLGKVEIKEAQPSLPAIFFGGASDWTGNLSEKIDFRDVGLTEGYIVMCTRGSTGLLFFCLDDGEGIRRASRTRSVESINSKKITEFAIKQISGTLEMNIIINSKIRRTL